MNTKTRRIAVNVGSRFIPGMNAALTGVTLAAAELGWEVVGVRNGFAGLLEPGDYTDGGLVTLSPQFVESLDQSASGVLGQLQDNPFHMRQVDEDGMVEEVDRSDELLAAVQAQGIDALVSIVGRHGLSIVYKLHRKGLNTVCIPRSVENDIAETMVTFGFNSALSFTIEMLDRARQAAQSSRQIVVVEVEGRQAGWLALQAGMAAGADAILIPELPIDLNAVAEHLRGKMNNERPYSLVVVAEGVALEEEASTGAAEPSPLRASLSPLATGESSSFAIHKSGRAAKIVAHRLQLLLAEETYPLVLGPWARGGQPTAVDRQLALAYGAGAIRGLNAGQDGVMVSFQPPDIEFVPLVEAINKVRAVPADSEVMLTARTLGICLGGMQ